MSRRQGSERKNPRLRRQQSSSNPRASPEGYYPQRYDADDLIFPMSLPQSISDTQQMTNTTTRGSRHNPQPSRTEPQWCTPSPSPSSGCTYSGIVLFSYRNASVTRSSMTSAGSEGFAQSRPQHHPFIPHQLPQPHPPPYINPQRGRALTAADFSRRYPPSPPSSSESSSRSSQSSVGSFTGLPPPFLPPTSPTRPIPIPRANSHHGHSFTPQYHAAPREHRRPRNNTDLPLPDPNDWLHRASNNEQNHPSRR